MENNIHLKSLETLNEAVQKCAAVVGATMGPAGSNVILEEKQPPFWSATNDGATIIERMKFENPIERVGHAIVKEATTRSNKNSGDGSSTTTLLVAAILSEGIQALKDNKISVMELKRQLDGCLAIIEKSIQAQTRQITIKDIPSVAYIAGENKELAKTLGEIYEYIGKEGIIAIEGSGTYETTYEFKEGVRFVDTGYVSPYMVHDEAARKAGQKETKAIYEHPHILVTRRKVNYLTEINPILQALYQQKIKDFVIFTDDMDSSVASAMVNHHLATKLGGDVAYPMNILIIKAPTLWKPYVFEDFAKVTGATIVEDASGVSWKNLKLEHFGTCDKLIVDKEETTIIGIQDISSHIEELQKRGLEDDMLRLAWLTTKSCILKLGSKSESELAYLRLKAEDAVYSCRRALEGGVVAGGGIALRKAAQALPSTISGKVLAKALKAPITQICANMGMQEPEEFTEDVIDSAPIVQNAIKNALGVASTLLTAPSLITLPPEKEKSQNPFPFM